MLLYTRYHHHIESAASEGARRGIVRIAVGFGIFAALLTYIVGM